MEKAKLHYFEVQELAIHICKLPVDAEDDQIEETLYDKFDISMDQLHNLAEVLVPLCAVGQSPLTEKWYRGFGNGDMWLAKQELPKSEVPAGD
jgi:hypothetical protein